MSNSPAHEEMKGIFLKAMSLSDRSFSPDGRHLGFIFKLRPLLHEARFHAVHTRSHNLEYSTGCDLHEPWVNNLTVWMDLSLPFIVESGAATREEVQLKSHQMALQMRSRQFCAIMTYLTAWGRKQLLPPTDN